MSDQGWERYENIFLSEHLWFSQLFHYNSDLRVYAAKIIKESDLGIKGTVVNRTFHFNLPFNSIIDKKRKKSVKKINVDTKMLDLNPQKY